MEDLSDLLKVRNFVDVMGYVGYVSVRMRTDESSMFGSISARSS
jgi:hypothetical protein